MFTIGLDPGHGLTDPGGVHKDIMEKDLNLEWGLALHKRLVTIGFNVVMTRFSDTEISLDQRAAMANKAKCDLFLSLHHNKYNTKAHGHEIYYYKGSVKGKLMAEYLEEEFKTMNNTRYVGYGIKAGEDLEQSYAVLRKTNMPAVLIEPLFIDNDQDRKLYNPYLQADLVVNAVCKYFDITKVRPLTCTDVLRDVTPNYADAWENGIKSLTQLAKANSDLGDLEIFKYLPDLIMKIHDRYNK